MNLAQSFNEELERVFDEVQLPEGEAWDEIILDLRDTKLVKQNLEAENKCVLVSCYPRAACVSDK